jgi:hypothetical protein
MKPMEESTKDPLDTFVNGMPSAVQQVAKENLRWFVDFARRVARLEHGARNGALDTATGIVQPEKEN